SPIAPATFSSADPGGAAKLQHPASDAPTPQYVTPLAGARTLTPPGRFLAPSAPPALVIEQPTDVPLGALDPTEPSAAPALPTATGWQGTGPTAGHQDHDNAALRAGERIK